jgi:RNA polymerase sigma-70 factor (ECF subfamily)
MEVNNIALTSEQNSLGCQGTEIDLLACAQAGELDAFNQLVLLYQSEVYNLAYWLVADSQTAEDVTQESFLKAFQHMRQFRGGSFRSWLLRITRNTCLDELRRQKRQPIDQYHSYDGEDGTPGWMGTSGSIQHTVENNELKNTIRSGIQNLHARFSQAVILVDIMTLEYAEAAAILNAPIGTIKSRVARGRMALRSHLTHAHPDGWQRRDSET